jgi:hypothetical protein
LLGASNSPSMATDQVSFLRKRHLMRVLFGIILGLLCVVFWPHNSKYLSRSSIVGQHAATIDSLKSKAYGTLLGRDDYSCSASNPCSNGACCGASGFCGYGPTYYGTRCLSQCDATAECGKYASTVNKTCPLNTCCSEYRFVSYIYRDEDQIPVDTFLVNFMKTFRQICW